MERILSDLELAAVWAAYNQFVKSHVTEQQSTAELEWAHWVALTVVGSSSNPLNWHDLEKRCISKKIDKLGRHPGLPTFFQNSTKQMVWVFGNMGDLNNVGSDSRRYKWGSKNRISGVSKSGTRIYFSSDWVKGKCLEFYDVPILWYLKSLQTAHIPRRGIE